MRQFIQKYGLICIGLALPIAVMLVFWLASSISVFRPDPPTFPILLGMYDYRVDSSTEVRAYVQGGALKAEYRLLSPGEQRRNQSVGKILLFDPKQDQTKVFTLVPEQKTSDQLNTWYPIAVPEVEHLKLDTSVKSPDGYTFSKDYRRSGGLLPELFVGSRSHYGSSLEKDGTRFPIPTGDDHQFRYNSYFLGWVRGDKEGERR